MNKVRAYSGRDYHFHIRIKCPAGDAGCQARIRFLPATAATSRWLLMHTDEALHPRAEPANRHWP